MRSQDVNVVNLTDFPLNEHHISLLKRGLSFSPKSAMQEFEVYKDINMFLRKVIFRSWHLNRENTDTKKSVNQEEQEALNNLILLLQENLDSESDSEKSERLDMSNRPSNLVIKSSKMPPISKHKWIKLFLDQVQREK